MHPSSHGRLCFLCKGAGVQEFKTSPEARQRARDAAFNRKLAAEKQAAAERAEKRAAWAADHADVHAWIVAKAPTFGFASSMDGALSQWGSLTVGQLEASQRLMDQDAARVAKPVERFDALHTVLQRHAKFYAGDLTISRKNADQLCWIKHANSEKVIGKLDNGVLTLWHRPGVDQAEVRSMLEEFEGAPLQTAMKYGKLAGRCCSCGRELTNDGSIEAGIGPVCATKFE